ncbi:MAG TPA: c-type cytochrome [Gemmatimonadales bacterium]|jgi:mono/diheme cytochrome c family protein|nr:c-type cytochrome [Gemmatimonadales bacterium]
MSTQTRLGLLVAFVTAGAASASAQTTSQTERTPAPAEAAGPAAATAVSPELIAQGDKIFHGAGNCYACHGGNAEGLVGPNLTDAEWIHSKGTLDDITAQVIHGVTKEESKSGIVMPPKGGSTISDDDVKAVAAYVYSLSHK